MLPFDIQTKGFLIGVVVGLIVVPKVLAVARAKKA